MCNLPLFNFSLQLSCERDEERDNWFWLKDERKVRRLVFLVVRFPVRKTSFFEGENSSPSSSRDWKVVVSISREGKLSLDNNEWLRFSTRTRFNFLYLNCILLLPWLSSLDFLTFFSITFFLPTLLSFHQEFCSYKTRDWSGRCILSCSRQRDVREGEKGR